MYVLLRVDVVNSGTQQEHRQKKISEKRRTVKLKKMKDTQKKRKFFNYY